jgi:molybdopterin-guanine dinucleotide biosynthesis protein A
MPFFDATAVSRLMAAAHALDDLGTHSDGVVFVDAEGRRQLLAAAYRTVSLRAALDALDEVTDTAVRDLAKRLTLVEIAADPETTLDCDTWTDVQRSHDALEER